MASYEPMEKQYDPSSVEESIYEKWLASGAFKATPDERPHAETFTMVIPPPNVTGAHWIFSCYPVSVNAPFRVQKAALVPK